MACEARKPERYKPLINRRRRESHKGSKSKHGNPWNPIRLEAIAIKLEAVAIGVEAIALRLEAIASRYEFISYVYLFCPVHHFSCFLPVPLSLALTLTMPLASISNATSSSRTKASFSREGGTVTVHTLFLTLCATFSVAGASICGTPLGAGGMPTKSNLRLKGNYLGQSQLKNLPMMPIKLDRIAARCCGSCCPSI